MQTNPEQWAVELWRKACHDYGGASIEGSPAEWRAALAIQAAFAEQNARNHTAATPVAWMPIESAPKGVPTKDVGCRGESEWFLGKPSGKYPQSAPFVAICRRAWPQDDSWKDAGDTHYRPDYFSEWCPIETSHPPATDVAALVEAAKKIMPIRVNDGPDYAEVYFADGVNHITHAMTMNPQDWLDLSAALAPFTKGQNDE